LSKGYFAEEGLNVTIDQGEGSAATVTRIMGGAYDAGFGDINAIIQNAAHAPRRGAGDGLPAVEPPALRHRVTPKSSGIETPADFEGRKLGGAQGTPTTRLFPVFAALNDIDLSRSRRRTWRPTCRSRC
jgi:NitT/TauT family transport system substrate-binding protein